MINRLILLLSLFLLVPALCLQAQTNHPWQFYLDNLMHVEDADPQQREELYDNLADIGEHSIDINTAQREDLERLEFLNEQQIADILEYVFRYGHMQSLGELQMIRSLDYDSRMLLSCFLRIGDVPQLYPKLSNIIRYSKYELMLTGKIPTYQRKGDKEGYLGYPYRHSLRFNMHYGNYLRLGLIGAQDSGEPFFANKNSMGYDYYAFYMLIHRIGRLETGAIGNYKIGLGMGLVVNSGFSMGKTMFQSMIRSSENIIKVNSSRNNYNGFRGVAATVRLFKDLCFTGFGSYHSVDATLNKDQQSVATVLSTSYHRTSGELQKKNNLNLSVVGINLQWSAYGIKAGVSSVYVHYSKPLMPKTTSLYRFYYPQGSNFLNSSLYYGYTHHFFNFAGETALDKDRHWATINTFSLTPSRALTVTAIQRFYSYKYNAPFANSFSEGGVIRNENGVYLGINYNINQVLHLSAYSDYAYFAWPRYQIARSSHVWDNVLSVSYHHKQLTCNFNYKFKQRQLNDKNKTALIDVNTHRLRLRIGYDVSNLSFRTQWDGVAVYQVSKDYGQMISEVIDWHIKRDELSVFCNYFDTDSYQSRLYVYEKGMQREFNFPMFYGQGVHYGILLHSSAERPLSFALKAAVTRYFDRNQIGSGLQLISRSSIVDIDAQLIYRF